MTNFQIKLKRGAAGGIGILGPLAILWGLWIWAKDGALVFLWALVLIPISLAFLGLWIFTTKPAWGKVLERIRDKFFSPNQTLEQELEEMSKSLFGRPSGLTDWQQNLLYKFLKKQEDKAFTKGLLYGIIFVLILWWFFSGPSSESLDPYVPFGD